MRRGVISKSAHFQHIAGLCVFDIDRPGHDMDAGIPVIFREYR